MLLETIVLLFTYSTNEIEGKEKWKIIELFVELKGNNLLDMILETLEMNSRSLTPNINRNEQMEQECIQNIKSIKEWMYVYECNSNQSNGNVINSTNSFTSSNELNNSMIFSNDDDFDLI